MKLINGGLVSFKSISRMMLVHFFILVSVSFFAGSCSGYEGESNGSNDSNPVSRLGDIPEIIADRLPSGGWQTLAWDDPGVANWNIINVTAEGILPGNGDISSDLRTLIANQKSPTVLYFPAGTYTISGTGAINLHANLIIRGDGPDKTVFELDNGCGGFVCYGYVAGASTSVVSDASPGATVIEVASTAGIEVGDVLDIEQDNDPSANDWANRAWGVVAEVVDVDVITNKVTIDVPLALGLQMTASPTVNEFFPCRNVGLESLKIVRTTDTGGHTIVMKRVVNGFIRNVESVMTADHHVFLPTSHRVFVSECFFDDAFSKTGGNGYGVLAEMRSSQIYIENNIFRNLRHHIAVQAGSSYVVFSYNYLVDTVRDTCIASNPDYCSDKNYLMDTLNAWRESDICFHGNYPHSTLLEGNVFYWGWVDTTHGANGPHNILYRNKAHGQPDPYGWWMEGVAVLLVEESPGQTVIGNVLLNDSLIKYMYLDNSVVTYNKELATADLLVGANSISGTVEWWDVPEGVELPGSLYLDGVPSFWDSNLPWPPFGPEEPGSAGNMIPAQVRYLNSL